ncbi:hypothetical protein PHMEG_0008324 [Phytophthora megakarya]|uniref:Uncharacterized protein n=1 Tax=Phytophthora megakarya TaxID=4795 RepID=A0A225WJ25_9STRA|nr:hypothetical protein PHMEG_0008324 [Phytophthora megakarya]
MDFHNRFPRIGTLGADRYCSHLVTALNFQDFMIALPCTVLTGTNIPEPMSFEITLQGLIAYWASTHCFPISTAIIRNDPYLALFVMERKNHRSHCFLITMRESWRDLDLVLDPFSFTLPQANG